MKGCQILRSIMVDLFSRVKNVNTEHCSVSSTYANLIVIHVKIVITNTEWKKLMETQVSMFLTSFKPIINYGIGPILKVFHEKLICVFFTCLTRKKATIIFNLQGSEKKADWIFCHFKKFFSTHFSRK